MNYELKLSKKLIAILYIMKNIFNSERSKIHEFLKFVKKYL